MAHVQSISEASFEAGTTGTLALTSVVAGNCLVAITRTATGASSVISGVSSSADGAFTLLDTISNANIVLKVWVLENASAGSHTITYTSVGTGVTVRWGVAEYGSVPTSAVVDDWYGTTFTTTTTPSTAAITTTGASRTIVSIIATDLAATSIAPAGGETERQEVAERFQFQDEAAATAGDYSASWTLGATQPGVYLILALKASATVVKYLKALTHSAAAGVTSVAGTVFNAPSGSDICGSRIGEFTGQSFLGANSLDGGKAKLLVNVSSFGGSALTASSAPVVYLRTSSFDTQIFPCTVIEV